MPEYYDYLIITNNLQQYKTGIFLVLDSISEKIRNQENKVYVKSWDDGIMGRTLALHLQGPGFNFWPEPKWESCLPLPDGFQT